LKTKTMNVKKLCEEKITWKSGERKKRSMCEKGM
jgi:hypothetical protein